MSVSHTIRYALFGELLTETVAAYQDATSSDPFGTWFVLPTRNLADVILRHPIAKERLILPDHILTARDLAQYISRETDPDLCILTSGEQDLLIRRILTSPDLRKSAVSLFGEVTHTTCSSLRTLITGLEQNLTDLSVIHSSTRKIETLSAIHQEYTRILKKEHLADKETVYETAVVALGSGKIPFRTVFIYGMYSPQPNEQAFINALIAAAESVHEVRPAVNNPAIFPGFTGKPIHGNPAKAAFAEGLFAGHEHRIPASLPVKLTTVIYPDTTAEVSSVLDQVSGLFEDGVSAEDILILSPAVKETVRLIDDIIDDFSIRNPDGTRTRISYTAATARPISNYPETTALLAVLKAPVADYPLATLLQLLTLPQIRKKFGIHTSQLFSLSQTLGITRGKSNWITIADQRIPFLLQKIEDAGTDGQSAKFYQVQIDELQKLQQGLISLIEEITPKNQKKQSVRQHCRDSLDLFIKLGLLEPAECEMPTEQQLRQKAFHDLISGLAASPVAQTISLTHAEFCDTLSELCSSTPAPLSPRTAKHTITVAGLRESALTSANHVFILGLSDKSVPRIQFTLPYLTVKETAKIKNTSFETDILREKYYFAAACLVAGESLHLS
ncbi:MAG TPA: exodeoxyribonuclease V subunit gamma, partial [Methanocorpusculum sp.]|nr:exodeoxyribonuclease V subunit gamma [Methanocorpusculum sp.]